RFAAFRALVVGDGVETVIHKNPYFLLTCTPVAAEMKCSTTRPTERMAIANQGLPGANFSQYTIVTISTIVKTITSTVPNPENLAPSRLISSPSYSVAGNPVGTVIRWRHPWRRAHAGQGFRNDRNLTQFVTFAARCTLVQDEPLRYEVRSVRIGHGSPSLLGETSLF